MTFQEYEGLYPSTVEEGQFPRLEILADRLLHDAATGVDGVDKLRRAPPEGQEQVLRACQAALVYELWKAEIATGVCVQTDGTVRARTVTGITAGSEAVTYGPCAGEAMLTRPALGRVTERYLSGVRDANGVPLLYAGPYPG